MSLAAELRSLIATKGIPEPLVLSTMLGLEDLLNRDVGGFIELVGWCRDRIEPLPQTRLRLERAGLLHDAVRDVVLVAVTGDGAQMELRKLAAS